MTAPIAFETSGSTGVPRRWVREPDQLAAEVDLVGDLLVGEVDQVITYASPMHLFGSLFGLVFPRRAGIAAYSAWADPFGFPAVEPGARVLVVCVPIAWTMLHRHRRSLARAGSVVALHSTAAPPAAAFDLVRAAGPWLRAHEILGSTETGGIAHRAIGDRRTPWTAFADVRLVRRPGTPTPEPLVVTGPRLARPEDEPVAPREWGTGDLVEYTGDRAFHLAGRVGSLIKVDGRPVHLAVVDEHLERELPGAECVTQPVRDAPLSGEGYVVFWAGAADLARVRTALAPFPGPLGVVELDAIPRTAAGKPDHRALAARLDSAR
jgi:acyl-coenzyme A synthetase/AMP-(fatty) acid ligase